MLSFRLLLVTGRVNDYPAPHLGVGSEHEHHGAHVSKNPERRAAAAFPFVLFACVNPLPDRSNLQPLPSDSHVIAVQYVGMAELFRLPERLDKETLRNDPPLLDFPA